MKRLEPRKSRHGFTFVFAKDMKEHHGLDWFEKYCKISGVNTHPVIDGEDLPEGYDGFDGTYYWDYTRFADQLEKGTPTYFD